MTSDQEEVARTFERYNLTSAPVVDPDQRLVGMITADDVVEVIQEEASEDILRLGGVAGELVSDPVWQTTKHRFIWLFVNLGTAILASWVISLFDATIEQMVALAVLMPIVASMGGNAGTQTMTVAVRALATQDLGAVNAARVIGRETVVGLLNGLMFALIMGVIAFYWFGSGQLGVVIGAAMIINLLVAALSGILDSTRAARARPRSRHRLRRVRHHDDGLRRLLRLPRPCRLVADVSGRAYVLLSRQGAVVPAATLHADRAPDRHGVILIWTGWARWGRRFAR